MMGVKSKIASFEKFSTSPDGSRCRSRSPSGSHVSSRSANSSPIPNGNHHDTANPDSSRWSTPSRQQRQQKQQHQMHQKEQQQQQQTEHRQQHQHHQQQRRQHHSSSPRLSRVNMTQSLTALNPNNNPSRTGRIHQRAQEKQQLRQQQQQQQPREITNGDLSPPASTTSLASQNRKSRIQRDKEASKSSGNHVPSEGGLMQKRLAAKQRRLENMVSANKNSVIDDNNHPPATPERNKTANHSNSIAESPARRPISQSSPKKHQPIFGTPNGRSAVSNAADKNRYPLSQNRQSRSRRDAHTLQDFHEEKKINNPETNMPEVNSPPSLRVSERSPISNNHRQHMHQMGIDMDMNMDMHRHGNGNTGDQYATTQANAVNPQSNHANEETIHRDKGSKFSPGRIARFHRLKGKGMKIAKSPSREHNQQQEYQSTVTGSSAIMANDTATAQIKAASAGTSFSAVENNDNGTSNLDAAHYGLEATHTRQAQQTPSPHASSPPKYQDSKEDATVLDLATDDDITLTSVRRVVAPKDQSELLYDNKDEFSDSPYHTNDKHRHCGHHQDANNMSDRSPRIWTINQPSYNGRGERDEKCDKDTDMYLPRSSSSDYDTDVSHRQRQSYNINNTSGSARQTYQHQNSSTSVPRTSRNNIHYPNTPFNGQYHPNNNGMNHPDSAPFLGRTASSHTYSREAGAASSVRLDDDDRTFDYGVRDDDSQGSVAEARKNYSQQQQRNYHHHQPQIDMTSTMGETSMMNDEDPEKFKQSVESPVMKTCAGLVGAATVGCIVMGPVGLLVGAAAVGIGVGVMQIPEEQRSHMVDKATQALSGVQESAYNASEVFSSSCASTYRESGINDHIPYEVADKFCIGPDEHEKIAGYGGTGGKGAGGAGAGMMTMIGGGVSNGLPGEYCNDHYYLKQHEEKGDEQSGLGTVGDMTIGVGADNYNGNGDPPGQGQRAIVIASNDGTIVGNNQSSPSSSKSLRSKKVACLRHVRIVPVNQIHGLDPSQQPRAWLDVLASADTAYEEKNEAMEEILLLAKDKQRARIFLEEGILDSIMWILNLYFAKITYQNDKIQVDEENEPHIQQNWAHPEISAEEYCAVKLAAACCVTLGKAHCAAIHTEGDLLLMSLYERGTVPEERQLAQLLYEVPHHARVTPKNGDPTIVDPSLEVFSLKQLTLPQAEELAGSIKALADGGLKSGQYTDGGMLKNAAFNNAYNFNSGSGMQQYQHAGDGGPYSFGGMNNPAVGAAERIIINQRGGRI